MNASIEYTNAEPMLTAREYMALEWPGAIDLMLDPDAPDAFAEDERRASKAAGYMGLPAQGPAFPVSVWREVMV